MQLCIVAAWTCFVRKSASIFISLAGFLPSEILPSVTIACNQRNTVSMCFTRPTPRRLPIAIPAVASIHTMGIELPSPVQENALQAKHLRCRTHQPTILRFAEAECNHGLSFAVRADRTAARNQRTTRNTLPSSALYHTTVVPLEQPNQPRTHSEKTSQSLQSHFIRSTAFASCVPDHGTRSVFQVCHWRDTVHASCSHDTDLTLPCRSEPLFNVSD